MDFLYKDRDKLDLELIKLVCGDILNQQIDFNKQINNEWGAVFVEGRDRKVNDCESFCAIKSFKLHCKYNAPVYCFLHNDEQFSCKEFGLLEKWNVKIIKIPLLDSLERYSEFCIKELYNLLPLELENVICIQPDGMLLRAGFEDWLIDNDFSLIGSHWRHTTGLDYLTVNGDYERANLPNVYGCNLGFSFRKVSRMKEIIRRFGHIKFKQSGDNNCPEDVFFSFLGYNHYQQGNCPVPLCKLPTLKECDTFAQDPLTKDSWDNKTYGYGFHYFRYYPEFPPCNHG